MPAIHVRNVPASVLAALRERARLHGRSVQREILEILENAAKEPALGTKPQPIQLVTVKTPSKTRYSREEIYGDEGR